MTETHKTEPFDINIEIKSIFDENKVHDLKRFMNKRHGLNQCSVYMLYLFHIVQSAGILISSVGASTMDTKFIWIGIAFNMIATIIQVYEKINDGQLKTLYRNIKAIKDNNYIDESPLVDIEKDLHVEVGEPSTPPSPTQPQDQSPKIGGA